MVKVLFVCTGNICRSPTAHGLLRARALAAGLAERIEADSAGTHGYHIGDPPDPRAIATAAKHGIDIGDLRARKVTEADFVRHDLVCALEKSHWQTLHRLCPPAFRHRVRLLMEFAGPRSEKEVPDPYYGGPEGFERVFAMIDAAVIGIVDRVARGEQF